MKESNGEKGEIFLHIRMLDECSECVKLKHILRIAVLKILVQEQNSFRAKPTGSEILIPQTVD